MRRFLLCVIAAAACVAGARAAGESGQEPAKEQIEAAIAALDGVVLARPAGGWVQIIVQDSRFVVCFFDEKAKPAKPDVDRATLRVQHAGRTAERVVLVPMGDGMALRHGAPLRGPFRCRLAIDFFRGESDEAVESYQTGYPTSSDS
jgi:hypothetical protein